MRSGSRCLDLILTFASVLGTLYESSLGADIPLASRATSKEGQRRHVPFVAIPIALQARERPLTRED